MAGGGGVSQGFLWLMISPQGRKRKELKRKCRADEKQGAY